MNTKEQYTTLLSRIIDAEDPAKMFAEMLKETYRTGYHKGLFQARENQRWETQGEG